jgi:hypothetical protein
MHYIGTFTRFTKKTLKGKTTKEDYWQRGKSTERNKEIRKKKKRKREMSVKYKNRKVGVGLHQ